MLLAYYQPSSSASDVGTDKRVPDRLGTGISNLVLSQFGRIGAQTIGVETLEIDPYYEGYFNPGETRVTLGGYFFHPDIYVYGKTSLSGRTGEAGFEYRLGRRLMLEGNVDEDSLYRLFINLHWDY
jgi:hypothetical protein